MFINIKNGYNHRARPAPGIGLGLTHSVLVLQKKCGPAFGHGLAFGLVLAFGLRLTHTVFVSDKTDYAQLSSNKACLAVCQLPQTNV